MKKTKTVSLKDVEIKTGSSALKVYPLVSYNKEGKEHKTVALKLDKQQAVELATNLLIGAKKWDYMHITAFRNEKSVNVTVTSQQIIDEED